MELHLILVTELVLLCLCVPNILIHGIKDSFSPEELDDLKESGPEYIVLDDYDPEKLKSLKERYNIPEEPEQEPEIPAIFTTREPVEGRDYVIIQDYNPDDPTAGMGDENMSEVKAGECPVISCNPLKKPKPCPEAVPEKVIIDWQDLKCEACPYKWDLSSCKKNKDEENETKEATIDSKEKPKVMEKKEL